MKTNLAKICGYNGIYPVKTFNYVCNNGCCEYYLDSSSLALFHKSRKYLFTYSLLFSYLFDALANGTSFAGFCRAQNNKYALLYASQEILDARAFEYAFISFSQLIKREELPFTCILCGL